MFNPIIQKLYLSNFDSTKEFTIYKNKNLLYNTYRDK